MDTVGVICAFFSAILMATIGVFSRYIGLPPEVITFFRLFLGASFMVLFLVAGGKVALVKKWPTFPVIFSGAFLAGFILLYIQAMNYTTMANAIMLIYLAPLVASIGAHFFLGERLTLLGLVCIATALFGFAMMMEFHIDLQGGGGREYRGILCAIGALVLYAGYIVINRMVPDNVHVYTRTFWQLLVGACVVAPWIGKSLVLIRPAQLCWLTAVGFFPGFLAILCAVVALHRLPAVMFGTIAYTEAVAVVIFGWTFFQEQLGPFQIAGCLLILLGGSINAVYAETRSLRQR